MRRFVVGDIHGAHKALLQVLERSGFSRKKDLLISLGDVVDHWPQTKECVEELLSLKHFVLVLGNHDQWFLEWLRENSSKEIWLDQGGQATKNSYRLGVPEKHRQLFEQAPYYYITDNMVFVHGGINPFIEKVEEQNPYDLIWRRDLFTEAHRRSRTDPNYKFGQWGKIFIGHTPTLLVGIDKPSHFCNVVAMDTGASMDGRLSLMNIDTGEFWQSDVVRKLYPRIVD